MLDARPKRAKHKQSSTPHQTYIGDANGRGREIKHHSSGLRMSDV